MFILQVVVAKCTNAQGFPSVHIAMMIITQYCTANSTVLSLAISNHMTGTIKAVFGCRKRTQARCQSKFKFTNRTLRMLAMLTTTGETFLIGAEPSLQGTSLEPTKV